MPKAIIAHTVHFPGFGHPPFGLGVVSERRRGAG